MQNFLVNSDKTHSHLFKFSEKYDSIKLYIDVHRDAISHEYSTVNIDKTSTASDYTVAEVKNEEVKVEENVEKKVHENNLIKAVLTTDGNVAIQLKKDFLDYHKLKTDTTKMYKVSGITGKVKDVFVCSMVSKEFPYVLLLMEDGTVEVVQILNEKTSSTGGTKGYEFEFYDQGKIEGLKNVEKFEEKTEPWVDSEKDFYYVNAIKKDGTRKQIDNLEYVNMNDVSTNRVTFRSQDGEKTYTIYADEEDYIQAFGWAGASNNVYYINDNCLYHKSLVDGSETKLVTGVDSIYTDEDGNIIAKLKFTNYIHRYNQYIKLEQYNVTDSKIIDQKEDDNFINPFDEIFLNKRISQNNRNRRYHGHCHSNAFTGNGYFFSLRSHLLRGRHHFAGLILIQYFYQYSLQCFQRIFIRVNIRIIPGIPMTDR